MKEWLNCCMDVCSFYKYSSDIGLKMLSFQSKIISNNIRISLMLSREKLKHARFLKSPYNHSLSEVSRFWSCRVLFYELVFPPIPALVCFLAVVPFVDFPMLDHFAPTASRKKNEQQRKFSPLWAQWETLRFIKDYARLK